MIAKEKSDFAYASKDKCRGCTGDLPRSPMELVEDPDYPDDLVFEMVVCASCETKIYEQWRAERLDPLRLGPPSTGREIH
jgi:hypothetical protein